MAGKDVVPYDPEKLKRDEARVERGFWDKVRRYARHVPFLEDVLAAYYCAADRSTPMQVKAVLLGALAYFVLPLDLIPDFITGLGFTDDAAVLFAAIRTVAAHITPEHRRAARATLDRIAETPRSATGAAARSGA